MPVILSGQNIVDDVEHVLKANTSVHLAEQETGGRSFIDGTVSDVITGHVKPDMTRPRIFSPFGLGLLDLAVARFVLDRAKQAGQTTRVDDFMPVGLGVPE